jgi:regulator of protease activity HflC (stomatin/prohibitin superfamily)
MSTSFGQPSRVRLPARTLATLAIAAAAALTAANCVYFVQPTEMAGLRRLGSIVSDVPAGPGLHVKSPIDTVDRLQVSLTPFSVDDLTVYTVDNQPVRIGIGLTYRVPTASVFKLLYTVGRSGNVDIDATLRPIVADRALRVFARHNTVSISAEREQIATEIRAEAASAIAQNFGLEITDLQLSRIEYSDAFTQSVEAAVKAKNEAIQAENTVARIRYEGEQAKVQAQAEAAATVSRAQGEAEATLTRARAAKESAILQAQGEAAAIDLKGAANAHALQLAAAAVASNPKVIEYETARRWSGQVPATMLAGAAVPFVSLGK